MIPSGFDFAGISAGKRMLWLGSKLLSVEPFTFLTDVNI